MRTRRGCWVNRTTSEGNGTDFADVQSLVKEHSAEVARAAGMVESGAEFVDGRFCSSATMER